jgi:outer membrane protein assembly factor BamB
MAAGTGASARAPTLSRMPSSWPRGARRWLAPLAILIVVIGGAAAYLLSRAPGNISHPDVSFTAPTTRSAPATRPAIDFQWPVFGYNAQRTRAFTDGAVRPPFRVAWRFGGNALLEFTPVIDGATLYFEDDGATAKAIDIADGRQRWATHLGTLSASSPALDRPDGTIILDTLADRGNTPGNGRVVSLSMRTGRVVWSVPLPSGSESSPIVWRGSVLLGDTGGAIMSLNARDGHLNWRYQAAGAVKGGVAISGTTAFVGDYSGHLYALNAETGHLIWAASENGADLGLSAGTFYSTPAVAYGRVYIGNTDGYVYSFAAANGQLAWAYDTGDDVYGSPIVADVPGLGPTVYIGSYSGRMFALDARSGTVRWSYEAGGAISGSGTLVDGVVYFSDLRSRTTTGLDARTGQRVFSFHDGVFTPVIADPHALFLDGYDILYKLVPQR